MVVALAAILKYLVGCDDYRIPFLVPFPGLTVHTMYSTHIRSTVIPLQCPLNEIVN